MPTRLELLLDSSFTSKGTDDALEGAENVKKALENIGSAEISLPTEKVSKDVEKITAELDNIVDAMKKARDSADISLKVNLGESAEIENRLNIVREYRKSLEGLDGLTPAVEVRVLDEGIIGLVNDLDNIRDEAARPFSIMLRAEEFIRAAQEAKQAIDNLEAPLETMRQFDAGTISPEIETGGQIEQLDTDIKTITESIGIMREAAAFESELGINTDQLFQAIERLEGFREIMMAVRADIADIQSGALAPQIDTEEARQQADGLSGALNQLNEDLSSVTYLEGIEGTREYAQALQESANASKEASRAALALGDEKRGAELMQEANAYDAVANSIKRLGSLTHSQIVQEFGAGAKTMDELQQKLQETADEFRTLGKEAAANLDMPAAEFYNNLAKSVDKSAISMSHLVDELNSVDKLHKRFGKFDEAFKDVSSLKEAKAKLEELRQAQVKLRDTALSRQDIDSLPDALQAMSAIKEIEDLDRAMLGTESHFKFLGTEAKGLGKIVKSQFNQLGFAIFVTTSTLKNFSTIINGIGEQLSKLAAERVFFGALQQSADAAGRSVFDLQMAMREATSGLLDYQAAMEGIQTLANEGLAPLANQADLYAEGAEAIELLTGGLTKAEDAYTAIIEAITTGNASSLASIPLLQDVALAFELSELRAEQFGGALDTLESRQAIVRQLTDTLRDLVAEANNLGDSSEKVKDFGGFIGSMADEAIGLLIAEPIHEFFANIDAGVAELANIGTDVLVASEKVAIATAIWVEGAGKIEGTVPALLSAGDAIAKLDIPGAAEYGQGFIDLAEAVQELTILRELKAPLDEISAAEARVVSLEAELSNLAKTTPQVTGEFIRVGQTLDAYDKQVRALPDEIRGLRAATQFGEKIEAGFNISVGAIESFLGTVAKIATDPAMGYLSSQEILGIFAEDQIASARKEMASAEEDIADIDKHFGILTDTVDQSALSVDHYTNAFSGFTAAIDPAKMQNLASILEQVNWILSDERQFMDAVSESWDKYNEKISDLSDALDKTLLDAAEQRNDKLLDAQEDYFKDLVDAFEDVSDKLQDIEEDLATKLRHMREDADDKEKEKKDDHAKKMLKIEDDYQKKIDDIMRKYELARIRALIDRDARALFEAQLARDEDLKKAKEDAEEKRENAKDKLDEELKDLEADEEKKRRRAEEAAEERRQDAIKAYDKKKEDMEEAYAEQQETINEAYDDQKKAAIENFEDQKKAAKKARDEQEQDLVDSFNDKAELEVAANIKQRIERATEFATDRGLFNAFYDGLLGDYGIFWDNMLATGSENIWKATPGALLWNNAAGTTSPQPTNGVWGVPPPNPQPTGGVWGVPPLTSPGGGVNVPSTGPCAGQAMIDHMASTPVPGSQCSGRIANKPYTAPDCSQWICVNMQWQPAGSNRGTSGTSTTSTTSSTGSLGSYAPGMGGVGGGNRGTAQGAQVVTIQTNDPTLQSILDGISYQAFMNILGGEQQ